MARIELGDIEISLNDPDSIQRAITYVKFLQSGVTRMIAALCDYLLSEGVHVAKAQLVHLGVRSGDSGPLANSIKHIAYDKEKGVGYLTAGEGLIAGNTTNGYPLMSYAVFVEEGTGVAKKQKKQPTDIYKPKIILKNANQNRQKETSGSGKGWVYLNEKDNHFYYTHGQPPKPFMYNTLMELWVKAQEKAPEYIATYIPRG